MDEAVEPWVQTARDDWAAAETLFSAGRWSHCVFQCHECLEKLLKAIYIQKKSSLPPTTHNITQLAQKLGLNPSQHLWDCLYDVSPHFAVTRYPELAGGAPSENYNQATAERLMQATREVKEWLEQHLKSIAG